MIFSSIEFFAVNSIGASSDLDKEDAANASAYPSPFAIITVVACVQPSSLIAAEVVYLLAPDSLEFSISAFSAKTGVTIDPPHKNNPIKIPKKSCFPFTILFVLPYIK